MGRAVWLIILLVMLLLLSAFALVRPRPETVTVTTTIAMTVTAWEMVTPKLTTITSTVIEALTPTRVAALGQVDAVCFSKPQDCASLIVRIIDGASRSVHVMMYSFTSDEIAEALIRAKNRGVDVKVVMESQQAGIRGSEYRRLLDAGIDVRLDGNPSLMHHKVVIIDGLIVITGSYNWSRAAEQDNDENLIVIRSPSIAAAYEEEFQRVWAQASS